MEGRKEGRNKERIKGSRKDRWKEGQKEERKEGRKRTPEGTWAGVHPLAGRFWPTGCMFDTPALKGSPTYFSCSAQNKRRKCFTGPHWC